MSRPPYIYMYMYIQGHTCICTCGYIYYVSLIQIFWDLASLSAYHQDMTSPLEIKENEVLGRGGYGFVCKGELILGVSVP